ncbi:MAG: metal-sulfur cluster assembly factor [Candidatus Zixiibacteriota bacterium]|nr:MAG: metal-sulfur cluster assembly factor [candidate division Zixibacteria bacterium]
MPTKEEIFSKLEPIEDPELRLGLVDLGLIYDVTVMDNRIVNIFMTLTTPGCPYGPQLIKAVENAVKELDGVEKVDVELVWEPPWDPTEMASEYARDVLGIW